VLPVVSTESGYLLLDGLGAFITAGPVAAALVVLVFVVSASYFVYGRFQHLRDLLQRPVEELEQDDSIDELDER
jgi:cytochrome c-type biogenesis protein CcmH/NrfG